MGRNPAIVTHMLGAWSNRLVKKVYLNLKLEHLSTKQRRSNEVIREKKGKKSHFVIYYM